MAGSTTDAEGGLAVDVGHTASEAEPGGHTDLGHGVQLVDEVLPEAHRTALGGVDDVVADEALADRVTGSGP